MKPAKFDYYCPKTVDEALALLEEIGFDGKIIAGGQSLVPIMNMRLSTPEYLIDINQLKDLQFIELDGSKMKIGALTRQTEIEMSDAVRKHLGLLSEAVPYIGHVQTRNRGTFGGSLVHADPSAEIPLSLMALGGTLHIASKEEVREVNVEEFFVTYLTTDIMPNELLTEIHVPVPEGRTGYSFHEISRRHGDFALVAAACQLSIDDQDRISKVRLVLGGVDAVPLLITDASVMEGEHLSAPLLNKIADMVDEAVNPESDLHATADYRRHLAKQLAVRTVKTAYERARGENNERS
ncbi:carbon-monoxide dehydrogenase medium subunit/2-furoyl-CoA dehydrogenase FAD binding subunit [Anoxybacillus vitaminiphilus]|jgi:2-furoyl-CoA dehydrogenase FAD binding subunit|uniref:Carbon-monoxide dehydrogenase medium subunit/2-furoyl-CoA dehydrogenase FAD binding subunit n=1 Tax=Paranoxybacillus vitaminiphilus TaxID=581036 RepID=A0A327YDI2_9BACL|nr:xanthine dehydrogenase family protein subunit M [Anoxybacillus vitaminiphilus]RAK18222.1 carbon-monoxide dehydrogenase medium subunit/2-furoyl-CoA dehydrogenase FAD binding subunit [Anoxybacillus vitaminiphilus]